MRWPSIWEWVSVMAVVAMLGQLGGGYRSGFTEAACMRGCVSHQNSLDKAMSRWESQNVGLPVDRELWIEFASDGKIVRVSPSLAAWLATERVPDGRMLRRGNPVIYKYMHDLNVFICPERWNVASSANPDPTWVEKSPEITYRWISGTRPLPALSGRKRGTVCLYYGEVGPRSDPEKVHRL